eukprot:m.340999 g.340999  ORF g.340999 m.340999 type:complete len:141 (+) comp19710_c0_seq1:291-713(+)
MPLHFLLMFAACLSITVGSTTTQSTTGKHLNLGYGGEIAVAAVALSLVAVVLGMACYLFLNKESDEIDEYQESILDQSVGYASDDPVDKDTSYLYEVDSLQSFGRESFSMSSGINTISSRGLSLGSIEEVGTSKVGTSSY